MLWGPCCCFYLLAFSLCTLLNQIKNLEDFLLSIIESYTVKKITKSLQNTLMNKFEMQKYGIQTMSVLSLLHIYPCK